MDLHASNHCSKTVLEIFHEEERLFLYRCQNYMLKYIQKLIEETSQSVKKISDTDEIDNIGVNTEF